MKFWLLTLTWNQMLKLVMLKTIWRNNNHDDDHNDDDDNNNTKPQQKSKHRLQHVADYQPGDRIKEGTQIFILLSVQQKV